MTAVRRTRQHHSIGEGFQREESSGATFKRLLGYLQPYRARLVLCGVLVLVAAVLTLIGPWLQGVAIDDFIATRDRAGLRRIVLYLVAAYLGAWISGVIYGRIVAAVAQRVMARLRQDVFARMQQLSMQFFDRNRTGDLMSRVTNDVDAIDQLLSQNLLSIVVSSVQIVSLLIVMTVLDWRCHWCCFSWRASASRPGPHSARTRPALAR